MYRMAHRLIVKFFVRHRDLYETLTAYLQGGTGERDAALMLMDESRYDELLAHLQHTDFPVREALQSGRLSQVGLGAALSGLTAQTPPDERWFGRTVVDRLERMIEKWSNVRVYAEFVDAFARRGRFGAVDRLEQLWSGCIERHNFALVCGYQLDAPTNPIASAAFAEVLRGSRRVLSPGETDSDDAVAWQAQSTADACGQPSPSPQTSVVR